MLLKELVEQKHVSFHKGFPDWESAVTASCQPLLDDGSITPDYTDAVIRCVKKFGPYIVFAPKIAMPHSQEGAAGVRKTALSFMKVDQPVHFEGENPEKDAYLFFTVAAENHDQHLDNMQKLSALLCADGMVDCLLAAKDEEDLLLIDKKYSEGVGKDD